MITFFSNINVLCKNKKKGSIFTILISWQNKPPKISIRSVMTYVIFQIGSTNCIYILVKYEYQYFKLVYNIVSKIFNLDFKSSFIQK